MPTRKISDIPGFCRDPDHSPPSHQVLEDGVYEHVCPSCNKTKRFTVSKPALASAVSWVPFAKEECEGGLRCGHPPGHCPTQTPAEQSESRYTRLDPNYVCPGGSECRHYCQTHGR